MPFNSINGDLRMFNDMQFTRHSENCLFLVFEALRKAIMVRLLKGTSLHIIRSSSSPLRDLSTLRDDNDSVVRVKTCRKKYFNLHFRVSLSSDFSCFSFCSLNIKPLKLRINQSHVEEFARELQLLINLKCIRCALCLVRIDWLINKKGKYFSSLL